jgi:hypothetical protein
VDVDHTWQWGRLYVDLCGGLYPEIRLGIDVAYCLDRRNCWGRRVSLHLLWWCVSVGVE